MPEKAKSWYLYTVRCRDGSLYSGITLDVERRLREHRAGGRKAAKYLRGRGPLELMFTYRFDCKNHALSAEARLKKLPKYKKERLLNGGIAFAALLE